MRRSGASFLTVLALAIALLGAAAFSAASAQEDTQRQDAQRRIDGWNATLDQVAATLRRPSLTANDLATLRDTAQTVHDEARALGNSLQPQIAASEARVQSLAPTEGADAAGETAEIQAVTIER